MRDVLYYTIRRAYSQIDVMRVTLEKPRRMYGSIDGIGVHCLPKDCFGRFESEQEASEKVAIVHAAFKRYEEPLRLASNKVTDLLNAREAEIEALLKEKALANA